MRAPSWVGRSGRKVSSLAGADPGQDLTSVAYVRELLRRNGLAPLNRLGQHFLVNRRVLEEIVTSVDPAPADVILEIGPGLGTVTRALAPAVRRLVAVEVDRGLVGLLGSTLAGLINVRVVAGDATRMDLGELLTREGEGVAKAVSNLPYYLTSPLLFQLMAVERVRKLVLMVQEEVAGRLIAAPATKEYGALTVAVNAVCQVRVAAPVSRHAFYPVPGVDSSLVVLARRDSGGPSAVGPALSAVTRAAFGYRRKTLTRALAGAHLPGMDRTLAYEVLARAGIDGQRRGETLSVEEFMALARAAQGLLGRDWPQQPV
ncbi:MAG TPA: ribosomal RNA small subunit methyltransferase A [Clostridiales bacterium]|nr:ribosomal RNA small subunit methyltransferase A [Clostridiales bacterium]